MKLLSKWRERSRGRHAQLLKEILLLNIKIDKIMDQQSQLNADVAAIQSALTGISDDVAGIQKEIADLQAKVAAGTPLDLTALDALAGQAAQVKTAVDGLVPASTPAPAPAPAPASSGN